MTFVSRRAAIEEVFLGAKLLCLDAAPRWFGAKEKSLALEAE
jgi:hypothetical protein